MLAALGRRRREVLWQRAFGRRLAAPEGDAAMAEEALRLGADDAAVQLLDTSLRQLSAALAAQLKPLPTVFAAHLGEGHLDLWGAPPDASAPYPGLVSLGMNDAGRIMVDLEVAHGLIAVRGPADTVRAALAALAVELVTKRWSDRMRVTLVGFGEGLEIISPERVVVAPSLEGVLPELERRAGELTGQLSRWGADSVLTGRLTSRDANT